MADEQAKRLYTREELESAIHDAKKAENRMATCEANIEHLVEALLNVKSEMNNGFKVIRAEIASRIGVPVGFNGWKRTAGIAGGISLPLGGLLFWLYEFLSGVQHLHIAE